MKVTRTFLLYLALLPMLAFGQVQLPIANGPVQATMDNLKSTAIWTDIDESLIPISGTRYITPIQYRTVKLNTSRLSTTLANAPLEFTSFANHITTTLALPMPDGSMETFRILESPIMEESLQNMFPEIRTYSGVSTTHPGTTVRFDFTPQGFHAMILIAGESTVFIDPYSFGGGDKEHYIIYKRSDFVSSVLKELDCEVSSATTTTTSNTAKTAYTTCALRTYRLALAATGEYTTFHGGTVVLAQAAQVTTMNRVNGVYERDLAVRMTIVANNNLLIYTNSGSDPYTNGNAGTMIGQNQTNTNTVIGNANYDIGHVFGTNSGGLAGLGVVCITNQKARGVTGSNAPIGDPFDIDYVAHEVGHQFGANHTFNNSCGGNRNNATAYEPGSGSSIMAYAGICPSNVQNNSDDHFHGISLQEMGNHLNSTSCPVTTALANAAPTITATNGNVTIPANTPFSLTATATDPNGNTLTYNWEQMNNEISTQPPVATATGGPNFRSFPSSTSPTRYFPNLAALAAGTATTWEVLPSVTRTMNFRVTVRDNAAGGSCSDYVDVPISVTSTAGPFVVTYPNATGITWNGASSQTVTWNVANTNLAPVNCANVDILLSIDGGLTYPTVVATNVTNDGSQVITVPNTPSTTCRIMVRSAGGYFFDISNNNFTIAAATSDYTLTTTVPSVSVCPPTNAVYNLTIGSIGGYSSPVTLSVTGVPVGGISAFSVNPVTPAGTSVLTISNTAAIAPGVYPLTVNATSASGPKSLSLTLTVNASGASAVTQTAPANGATGVSSNVAFTWTTAPEVGVTYEIQIATNAGFGTIVDQAIGLTNATFTSALLASSTTYYWRVRAVTACGSSAWSSGFSFTTSSCTTIASTNVPVAISALGTPTVTSTLTSTLVGTIQDVNVTQLLGTHTWMSDLAVTITSPAGTTVSLFAGVCTSQDNFNLQFDDAAAPGALPCPPTTGLVYQPAAPLSAFNGQNANGTWTLTISDLADQDGGSLTAWALQICTAGLPPVYGTDTQTSCGPITWIDGNVYSSSNSTATHTLVAGASNGADSIVTLNLTVNTPTSGSQNITGCVNYTWSANGTTYSTSGIYTATLTNAAGCDSIATLNLTIGSFASGTDVQTACGSYTWINGTTYTASNSTATYTYLNGSVNGCDSIVTLNLTINNANTGSESASACGSYTWAANGSQYTTSGMYTTTLTNAAGCDSVVTLNLTINNATSSSETVTACESYSWAANGAAYSSSGVYTHVITNAAGCDSTLTLNLTINQDPAVSLSSIGTYCDDVADFSLTGGSPAGGTYSGTGVSGGMFSASTAGPGTHVITYTYTNNDGCTGTATSNVIVEDCSSLDELSGTTFAVFPNPVQEQFVIASNASVKAKFFLYDATGRIVIEGTLTGETTPVSLVKLASGTYTLEIEGFESRISVLKL